MSTITLDVQEKAPSIPIGTIVINEKITNPRGDTEGNEFSIFWARNWETNVLGYYVYRSLSPNGPFIRITPSLLHETNFIDKGLRYHANINYYYSISAVNSFGESKLSKPKTAISVEKSIPRLNEIIRRHFLLLELDGELVHLFIRKQSGKRCPECYDEQRMASNRARCLTCFNTTYEGGYEEPIPIRARIAMAPQAFQLRQLGFEPSHKPILWTTPEPKINDWDIIVTNINKRYEIMDISRSPVKGIILHQKCNLELKPDTDIIYLLGTNKLKPQPGFQPPKAKIKTKEEKDEIQKREQFPESINIEKETKDRYIF